MQVMGSNPIPSIESSVRVTSKNEQQFLNQNNESTKINIEGNNRSNLSFDDLKMRDLYHRKEKLEYWVERVRKDLEDPDRDDVLQFIEYLQEKNKSILWIIRCITALLSIRRQLDKPFKYTTKEDIKLFLKWMEQKTIRHLLMKNLE
jgi:hypothetical protein